MDRTPSFVYRFYKELTPSLAQEEGHLLERDFRRTEEFWDQFCSQPSGYLVAFREERVIGRVRLYQRPITFQRVDVLLGGIGFVGTVPAYRRQGVATALLRMGMEQMASENCEVVFLMTDLTKEHLVRMYAQVGFVQLRRNYVCRGKSGRLYVRDNGLIAPLTSPEKSHLILTGTDVLDLGGFNW
jgi:predicted acetyltransferase